MLRSVLTNLLLLLVMPLRQLRRAFAIPKGGYVVLDLDGPVVDTLPSKPRGLARILRRVRPPLSVTRVRELCELIAGDDRAAGLFVRLDGLSAGPSVLASLRKVFASLEEAGKEVVFYLPTGADNDTMYLASAGSRVVVGPETLVAPIGYAATGRYLRRALAEIGVEPEVFARGTYKSAAEPLVRDAMSEAQREQLGEVLGARHDALVRALAERCGGDVTVASRWVDEAPYRASRAAELGLVDAVAYEDEVAKLLGKEPAPTARWVSAGDYFAARRTRRFRPLLPRPVVGLVEVHGPIVSRSRFSLGKLAVEDRIVRALRAARSNRRIAAVVLHIDSPGGSAVASDRIHHEVELLAKEKPVVAYLSNVAASGGYYVAAAARVIIAEPQVITGSIGVVSAHFVLRGLLEKLGVSTDVVKRGARADLFSPVRPLEASERAVLESEVDAFYRTFVGVVARGRGRPFEDIDKLAQGRIYSGTEARARGLVDELGGFSDAVARASDFAGLGPLEPRLVTPPRGEGPPPAAASVARTALSVLGELGLSPVAERALLGLNLAASERVLVYEPWGSDGRTWLELT
ncbi:signal peptide peptidase SppA [Polyangium sp. y55x31]|uniref:signal peptide peptidase SppA n=1 Tax=Polyangium sp. y55x31 TaxID=3042688 RepID=UPI002482528D|nr:signal peptide peptidase SppA [Polyangium sp. y55x31]MDI1478638.1 signal peptide peptidase SppA [Polyangium sp. y55x31]